MLRLKALANEDTLLPTQMFPRLLARATFVADTNFVSGTKNVSDFVQKHFVSATNVSQFYGAQETSWATMCPRIPGPLSHNFTNHPVGFFCSQLLQNIFT